MGTAMQKLELHGWDLVVGTDGVPRVRDLDLGERLGFGRPADFRKLVKRLLLNGILNDNDIIATVARAKVGHGWREVSEYHLTERGALKAIVKSEVALAVKITEQVIDLFLALRGLGPPPATAPIELTQGPHIDDVPSMRAELVRWCGVAAKSLGVSLQRVHGAIRHSFNVGSPYLVSIYAWDHLRKFLEDLTSRRLCLPSRRAPRLPAPRVQLLLPWPSRRLTARAS